MMNTFKKFVESKILREEGESPPLSAPPSGGGGGIGGPASMPMGSPMGGGLGGGIGAPPLGGAGLGGPPMGGMGGAPGASSPSTKLKAYNVWDVLERVLKDEN